MASVRGIYKMEDGSLWIRDRRKVVSVTKEMHRQGYLVRTTPAKGGGYRVRAVGQRKVRTSTRSIRAAQNVGKTREWTPAPRYQSYGGGGSYRHVPSHRPAGHTGHQPMGYRGSGSSMSYAGIPVRGSGKSGVIGKIHGGLIGYAKRKSAERRATDKATGEAWLEKEQERKWSEEKQLSNLQQAKEIRAAQIKKKRETLFAEREAKQHQSAAREQRLAAHRQAHAEAKQQEAQERIRREQLSRAGKGPGHFEEGRFVSDA